MEALTFIAFVVVHIGALNAHKLTRLVVLQKLSKNHYVVWLFHPAVLHASQDYLIHLADLVVHTVGH